MRRPLKIPPSTFEQLVAEALDDLPPFFQEKLDNVEVLVQPWPTPHEVRSVGLSRGHLLLGLYRGIPLTERTQAYNLVTPDTVTLFQGPIELVAGKDHQRVRDQVRHTVIHEIAHFFGISDDRLRELGAY
jgi:predicted Zn-dependent protease with MMP-like domain